MDAPGRQKGLESSKYLFEIPLRTIVKKNNRDIGRNKKTGQLYPIKNKELIEYEKSAVLILQSQLNKLGVKKPLFTGPVVAKYYFLFKEGYRGDWDNLCCAPQDCAQEAGIFKNDNQIKIATGHILEHSGVDKAYLEYSAIPEYSPEEINMFKALLASKSLL